MTSLPGWADTPAVRALHTRLTAAGFEFAGEGPTVVLDSGTVGWETPSANPNWTAVTVHRHVVDGTGTATVAHAPGEEAYGSQFAVPFSDVADVAAVLAGTVEPSRDQWERTVSLPWARPLVAARDDAPDDVRVAAALAGGDSPWGG